MRFGILGGPEIIGEKGTLPIAAPRQRVVVATLLHRLLRAETC
jgi:DNA-binding SARP family transcriptional activator